MSDMDKVIALTRIKVDLSEQKDEILNLVDRCPPLKQKLMTEKFKGKGFLHIQRFPKIFRVRTVISKEEKVFDIPVETVQAAWRAILQYPLNQPHKSKAIAEKWCKEMGITRFNRQSGSFDGDKMYGMRSVYFQFYYSLKILEHLELINYHKNGMVERIKNEWVVQSEIGGEECCNFEIE